MTASSPSSVVSDNSLPLPRLVLRLGGLGNRNFGSANGIAEAPDKIRANVKVAIETVLTEIESILKVIQEQDLKSESYLWPEELPKTEKLARFLLRAKDRWGIESMRGKPLQAFTSQQPLIALCTGGAEGTDTILTDLVGCRPTGFGVEYQTILIAPEVPRQLPTGLGVGSIPKKLAESPDRPAEGGPGLPRSEAEERSVIARQRAFGFRAQSEALRHHSDILIAVWDPHAEGKAGGTSESVAAALNERVPVIAVRILGEDLCDIRILTSPHHLRVLNHISAAGESPSDKWQTELSETLTGILKFPDPEPEQSLHGHNPATCYHPRAAFHVFFGGKTLPRIWTERFWLVYEAFGKYRAAFHAWKDAKRQQHSGHRPARTLEALDEDRLKARTALFSKFREQCSRKNREPAVLSPKSELEMIQPTYDSWYRRVRERAASDGMSGVYGDAHRGGILASYVLAAVAVMLAVFGGILHFAHAYALIQVAFAVAELFVIVLMFAIAGASRLEDWNLAYTESRILAEALRMMEHLGPLGVHTPLPKLPYYLKGDPATPQPDRMWSVWYFRALARMAPLRLGLDPEVDLQQHRTSLEKLVTGQRDYHMRKSQQHLAVHHDVESASQWLFVFVFLCVAIHILDIASGKHWFAVVGLVVCVGAPAMIAALHGLVSQIELSRLRQRSSSVAWLLEEQYSRINLLDLKTSPDSADTVWTYTIEVLSTASLMMDETAGWSMLYRNSDIHAG